MQIAIDDASIMAIQQIGGLAGSEVQDFIWAVDAANNLQALKTIYDDVEMTGSKLTFLAKSNEQHVAACVQVEVNQKGEAVITVTSYD